MIYDHDETLSAIIRLVLKHDNVAVGSAICFALLPAMKYSLSQMPKRTQNEFMQHIQEFVNELLSNERGYTMQYREAVVDLIGLWKSHG